MDTNNNKPFADGVWITEHKFSDGGSILKVGIAVDKLVKFLKKYQKENGFVDLVIREKRIHGDKDSSHNCYLDDWKPSVPKSGKTDSVLE